MRVIHSFAARSCFDKLSTNGEFLPSVVFAVRPEPVEGRLSMDNHQVETVLGSRLDFMAIFEIVWMDAF
jgi:hypothetical protein